MAILRPQHPFIGFDQTALADGCHRLQVGQFLGPGAQPHAAHAGTYGSGTHQHNLPAAVEKFVELLPQGLDSRTIEESVGAGKHAGADLHDQYPGSGGNGLTIRIGHGQSWENPAARERKETGERGVGRTGGRWQRRTASFLPALAPTLEPLNPTRAHAGRATAAANSAELVTRSPAGTAPAGGLTGVFGATLSRRWVRAEACHGRLKPGLL